MSIKIDDKIGRVEQDTTDINWDDFKVFLEGKGLANGTIGRLTSEAKRVVRDGLTEDNMYERCSLITRNVRKDVRRAIRRINEYKKWEENKCQ